METVEKKRILFVDDESMVHERLRRMLRPYRQEWEMTFVTSGQEALLRMGEEPYNIIISDMRMPGMDGATLLSEVMARHPETVRFILSGQSDRDAILRSVGSTHQFLTKPCDLETIRASIERTLNLKTLLRDRRLKKIVSRITNLPSLPDLYMQLKDEIQSRNCSMQKIGQIIEKDVAMSVKVLQIVNSAFFGLKQRISSPSQAVSLLGIDVIQALVLVSGIFSTIRESDVRAFSLKSLWDHSLSVALRARTIASQVAKNRVMEDETFKAGMFHDVGKLVLAICSPDLYNDTAIMAKNSGKPHVEAEYEKLETSHAEVGAYLLGLWGFVEPTVEAVAYHHNPGSCVITGFHPVIATYIADCLDHEYNSCKGLPPGDILDSGYIKWLGYEEYLVECRKLWTITIE